MMVQLTAQNLNLQLFIDSLGVFTLKLTVTDTEGASSSDTVRVTVQK